MANFDSLVIDRVVDIIAEDFSDNLLYMLNNLSNVSINVSSETKDKTDALGVLIKRFYTAKSIEVSADCNLLSLSHVAAQSGSEKIVATEDAKITAPKMLFVDATGKTEYTLPEGQTPTKAIQKIYGIEPNGTVGKAYTLGVSATADKFAYNEETRKITFPTGLTGKVLIKYEYETASGVKVVNQSDKYPGTVRLTMKVLVADTCSVDTVRAAYIVFPSFQPSPDMDLTLDTDSTIPYTGVVQRDYCAVNSQMFYIVLTDDEEDEE